jgi:hypothetical protein
VLAEADDRDERRVRALAQRLRTAIEQGASTDRLGGLTRAALGFQRTDDGVSAAFHAWQEAQARYLAADPAAPEAANLHGEVDRLWAAYETAVDLAEDPADSAK